MNFYNSTDLDSRQFKHKSYSSSYSYAPQIRIRYTEDKERKEESWRKPNRFIWDHLSPAQEKITLLAHSYIYLDDVEELTQITAYLIS